ncbi:MAG: ABC-F family ATP-binding cassette domain-containing protein [Spirochaetes bacterium]|nr:ABC-F family ATP-binding cassette domain-containing protein [Spirochaetota bacterium]
MQVLQLSEVSFSFPSGGALLEGLSLSLNSGVTALAGPNGAGKTTLMRLMMHDLIPQRGSVAHHGITEFGWLAQSALTGSESSGQAKMRRLSELMRDNKRMLFLDEPETHLDYANRRWLAEALRRHRGIVVMATHDPTLIDTADAVLHIEKKRAALYRMPYAEYIGAIESRDARAVAAIDKAEQHLKNEAKAQRMRVERQEKRSLNAARRAPNAGIPRIMRGLMKRNAEKTLGKIVRQNHERSEENAEQLSALRAERGCETSFAFTGESKAQSQKARLELNNLQLYHKNGVALWQKPVSFSAQGGDKVALQGKNGAGKSMLLKKILGARSLESTGEIFRTKGEIRLIDPTHSALEPDTPLFVLAQQMLGITETGAARRLMGGYGFAGDAALRSFATLSAGEKMRFHLLLIAQRPEPYAGIFSDEAETGLDRKTRALYADFLNAFGGITLVVSHDAGFMDLLDIGTRVVLDMSPDL